MIINNSNHKNYGSQKQYVLVINVQKGCPTG
jgi:hypothetical protein